MLAPLRFPSGTFLRHFGITSWSMDSAWIWHWFGHGFHHWWLSCSGTHLAQFSKTKTLTLDLHAFFTLQISKPFDDYLHLFRYSVCMDCWWVVASFLAPCWTPFGVMFYVCLRSFFEWFVGCMFDRCWTRMVPQKQLRGLTSFSQVATVVQHFRHCIFIYIFKENKGTNIYIYIYIYIYIHTLVFILY